MLDPLALQEHRLCLTLRALIITSSTPIVPRGCSPKSSLVTDSDAGDGRVAEQVYATDLKSVVRKDLRVRVPPRLNTSGRT
jgi:hypothetical protein